MKFVAKQPGVRAAVFDQCMLGLVSPVDRIPMKKATKVLTNSNLLFEALDGKTCCGTHQHTVIQGSEGGQKRSQAAQVYPPEMVRVICQALRSEELRRP